MNKESVWKDLEREVFNIINKLSLTDDSKISRKLISNKTEKIIKLCFKYWNKYMELNNE